MQIEHVSYAVSKNRIPISALAESGVMQKDEAVMMEKLMGLKVIPRDDLLSHYEVIEILINQFLSEMTLDRLKVKYIFLAHTAEQIVPISMPHFSSLMREYGFHHAFCFGSVVNKCAATFHFFSIAEVLFQSMKMDEYIIVIQCDNAFTPILQYIPGSTIMGDASSLVVLSKEKKQHRVLDISIEVDTRFHHGVFAQQSEHFLFQQNYIQKMHDLINGILYKNKIPLSQIALIFPHNVNLMSWKAIAKTLSFPLEKLFLDNVPILGHCFGSDPFINLKDALLQNRLQKEDYYLLMTVGLGATFAAMLCRY